MAVRKKQEKIEPIKESTDVKETEEAKEVTPKTRTRRTQVFSPKLIGAIADEVSKTLITRLPSMLPRSRRRAKVNKSKAKIENALFLDTSAIIDSRIFDVIYTGLLNGTVVITDSILRELKHIADAQDTVRRERGRKGLEALDKLKKTKKIKLAVLTEEHEKALPPEREVDEHLIKIAKYHKGKLITCDYNLEKKASIENVTAINVNALANSLKVVAVPGEALHVKISHQGKDPTQGVGYLDDGTMIVVEEGSNTIGKSIDVVVSRVIQTATGRILFAKKYI